MICKTNALFRDLLALVSVAGGVSSAYAIDKSWTFPLSGNVSIAGQWTPVGVPLVTDDWIFNPTGTYTVTFDAAAPDASNTLSFRDNSTITVVNPSVTHVTNEVRVGSQAGPLSVTLTDGSIRADTFALASIVANGEGTLIATNVGTSFLVEDNGLVRIANNTGATATMSLRDGATLTDITNPPGVPTDTGRIVLGENGTLEADGGSILLDEWELDMSAGGTLELANGGLVEIQNLILGATSVVRGSGTFDWSTMEAEPTAIIENVGNLTFSSLGTYIISGTFLVNAGVVDWSETTVVLSGISDPSTIVLRGGTARVNGGDGTIKNYSAVTGFGVIDATVDNNSTITPTLGGITITGELDQSSSFGSINGTRVTLAPGSSFVGKGTVNSGFIVQPGSSLTLTGDANFGRPALGPIGSVELLADANLAGFVGTFNTAALLPLPAGMILNQGTLVVPAGLRIDPTGELRGPGVV